MIKLNIKKVKSPNWREANQSAIYERGRGVELGTTEKQIQLVVELGTSGLRVQGANHSSTLPPFLNFHTRFTVIRVKAKNCHLTSSVCECRIQIRLLTQERLVSSVNNYQISA